MVAHEREEGKTEGEGEKRERQGRREDRAPIGQGISIYGGPARSQDVHPSVQANPPL